MALTLVLDLEYDLLFFDSEKNRYYLYLLITHICWYEIILELDENDVFQFMSDGKLDQEKFRKFASAIAASRPGLTYMKNSYDSKILDRSDSRALKIEELMKQKGVQK